MSCHPIWKRWIKMWLISLFCAASCSVYYSPHAINESQIQMHVKRTVLKSEYGMHHNSTCSGFPLLEKR